MSAVTTLRIEIRRNANRRSAFVEPMANPCL